MITPRSSIKILVLPVLALLSHCSKEKPIHAANVKIDQGNKPSAIASTGSSSASIQQQKISTNEEFSNLGTFLGKELPEEFHKKLTRSLSALPDLQNPKRPDLNCLFKKGSGSSGLASTCLWLKGNRLIALNYIASENSISLNDNLLKIKTDYKSSGVRIVNFLDSDLSISKHQAEDYVSKQDPNLNATTIDLGGNMRIVFYDSRYIDFKSLVKTADDLPAHLIDQAKKAVERQRKIQQEAIDRSTEK